MVTMSHIYPGGDERTLGRETASRREKEVRNMRRTIAACAAVTATALLLGACGGTDPAVSEKGAVATTATTAATTGNTGSGGVLAAIFGSAECQRAALTMSQAMTAQ